MESGFELQLLSAFVDDSLDAQQRLAVEERIAQDPHLRDELHALRRLRATVQIEAERFSAPVALRVRIRRLLLHTQAGSVPFWATFSWRRWLDWRPLALALSFAVVAWSSNVAIWRPGHDERLMQAAVSSHLQAITGRRLVDVSSSDRLAVQPWLSARLGFSAPVQVPAFGDVTLVGARLDSLEGRSVAAVVYRLRDHLVNAFVWPATDDDVSISSSSLRGFNVSHWSQGGLRYCVVSDLSRGQVMAFAQALAQADELR